MTRRVQGAAEPLAGVPGLLRWSGPAGEVGTPEPQAWAITNGDRVVLIDPLPLPQEGLGEGIGRPEVILLTGPERQRTAFRLRRQLGIDLFAPADLDGLDEEPDLTYSAGDALPGGLAAFHAPGPNAQTQVLWTTRGPRGVLFLSGLLVHGGSGVPELARELAEPDRARASVERLLARLPVDVLCFLWGPPIVDDGSTALRRLLASLPEPAAPGTA
ncbi:MAG: MBL fold metallo-hydrolase [Myxococcales bacterium]